ncbi:hypothetical protein [Clostridium brassicae]|uniref:TM2 domain-containing protein n=1 Tax=Clostridium brassicae TaxID=2999072 RepID=A0ABT4DCD5_9CLOT|nr:hypothetical protein [Clostridium brassicae]MCY6958684.1 hypothetical protein [Clostridium brassicae]
MRNKKFWALFFSMIPGAGHMYLGLSKKGLQLMALFFIAIGFADVLHLSMVAGLIPIIWFYSVFDVRKCYELNVQPNDNQDIKIPWSGKETKILGYIFIFMGAISIVNEIIFPMLDVVLGWRTIHSIKTGILSAVFIVIGLKLIIGRKVINDPSRLLKSPSKRGESN